MIDIKDQDNNSELDTGSEIPEVKVSPILKWSIIIMTTLIVVILTVIISTIIYRAVKSDDGRGTKASSARGFGTVDLGVSKGAKIGGVKLDNKKMTIVMRLSLLTYAAVLFSAASGCRRNNCLSTAEEQSANLGVLQ